MSNRLAVLHPGVETEANVKPIHAVVTPASQLPDSRLAPRLPGLQGKRLALLENTKVNARQLLMALAKRLQAQYSVGEVRMWHKHSPAAGAKFMPEIMEWHPDLVLNALGD